MASVPGDARIPAALRCCCGSADCAFLAHNGRLLDGLERDVSRAAQLGQALLVRHEAYVADAERDRRQMAAAVERLEGEKLALEARNAQTIRENRDLLDQLERLHDAGTDADAHVQALADTLRSAEAELERLGGLAARTQLLETQLLDLERGQAVLQRSLDAKQVDERAAVQRWRTAERAVRDLHDQIDRIEREAREERERHVEVVARMERRLVVDAELSTAAGRLKAKTADKSGTNVVSHFVKDILLDNANLQHGILELREMLVSSNEEVEHLREQLRVHQPVSVSPTEDVPTPSLQKELGSEVDPVANPELHIHHHYHGPKPSKMQPKAQAQRRPKKKRFSLTPSHFDPPPQLDRSSTATILSQTAVTVPNTHRWSQATTLAPSSLPGSPVSDSHRGSIYERVFSDVAYDSSRPTSPPDSIDLQSPMFGPTKSHDLCPNRDWPPRHQRRKSQGLKPPSLATIRSVSTPLSMTAKSSPATALVSTVSPANSFSNDVFVLSPALLPEPQAAIPEEDHDDLTLTALAPPSQPLPDNSSPTVNTEHDTFPTPLHHPTLRRPASHESLISISGMDIHTLSSRPAQLLYSSSPRFNPSTTASARTELTPWTATAHGSLALQPKDYRDSLLRNRSLLHERTTAQRGGGNSSGAVGIGRKVGGWVFGKWGAAPASTATKTSTATTKLTASMSITSPAPGSASSASSTRTATSGTALRPTSAHSAQTQSTLSTTEPTPNPPKHPKPPFRLRPSGVNQSGPIWGFFDIPEAPSQVEVAEGGVDREALGEALGE